MLPREISIVKKGMKVEMSRALAALGSPGHPKPYFISYLLKSCQRYNVWGRYGAVWEEKSSTKRVCFADVRVGSHRFDNVIRGGLEDNTHEAESFDMVELPLELTPESVRFSLWRLTDARYREAVANYYTKKSRDISYVDLNKGVRSFEKVQARSIQRPLVQWTCDQEKFRVYVRKVSAALRAYPEVKNSYVELKMSLATKIFQSSEGTSLVWQEPLVEVICFFWFLGKKSEDLSMTLTVMGRTADDLPDARVLAARVRDKVAVAYRVERGVSLNSYAGPVLLCAHAAGLFLHEAVGHRLESSRFLSDDEGRSFRDKLGEKIMHEDLSIVDDPGLQEWQGVKTVGGYEFDDEGIPSQGTELVRDGVLVDFLRTRSAFARGKHASNGHARTAGFQRPISRMANFVVKSRSALSWADLKERLLCEIRKRGLPFGVILYAVEGGETGTDAYDFQAFLGEITVASKIFSNGREVDIKGVDFVGTPLASLNQILAVGGACELDNGYCGAESGVLPVSTIAPPLLLANLELQAKDPTKVTPYRLPLPWFDPSS